jgi:hypothetical protein
MNYEKKYKKALEWMQGLYSGLHGATKEDAEHYFPELKESEDERIRKTIIRILKGEIGYTSKGDIDKYVTWLEKQGEKKLVDKVEPKFKVGDKVTIKGDNTVYTIGIIAPDKTCWLTHESRAYGWATFGILKHYVE